MISLRVCNFSDEHTSAVLTFNRIFSNEQCARTSLIEIAQIWRKTKRDDKKLSLRHAHHWCLIIFFLQIAFSTNQSHSGLLNWTSMWHRRTVDPRNRNKKKTSNTRRRNKCNNRKKKKQQKTKKKSSTKSGEGRGIRLVPLTRMNIDSVFKTVGIIMFKFGI